MKKCLCFLLSGWIAISLSGCFINDVTATREEILKNISLKDNSYIGLLNFCNFSGTVENRNRFKIDRVQLKATFYNKSTKGRSYYQFNLGVPVTTYGSATYQDKTFVGKGIEIEKVEVIHAEYSH